MNVLQQLLAHTHRLFARTIWQSEVLGDRSLRGRTFAVLRVASMTWSGILENSLASRAGALSYSSMLGLGPLVALAVLFSSLVLERTDPNFAVNQLNRALVFVAPQVRQLQQLPPPPPANGSAPAPVTQNANGEVAVNPELVNLLNTFIQGSQSKAIGIVGALALIIIVIQLFSSIENAFNDIWGVRRGRNWVLRIVFYWAAVTLGAVLAFASLTLLSASTFINVLESLPLGSEIRSFFQFLGPLISLGVLALLLMVFYKFIPNTSVGWRPSMIGALVAVGMLYLNNLLAFVYLGSVIRSQSLFGSFGLPVILMLGLYVFWLFLLVGGQITYAVQNANYRSSRMAWHDLNHNSREGIALLVFALICRRFRDCRNPLGATQLSELIKIPTQVLNVCLDRLIGLNLVSRLPPEDGKATQEYRYQPARPLDRMTLLDFKQLFDGFGAGPSRELLASLDPIVRHFYYSLEAAMPEAFTEETIQALIDRLPGEAAALAPAGAPAAT